MVETGKVDLVLLWDKSENLAILILYLTVENSLAVYCMRTYHKNSSGGIKKTLPDLTHTHTHI